MRIVGRLVILGLALLAAACADGVLDSNPRPGQNADLLGGTELFGIELLRCAPLAPETVTAQIGVAGGTLRVGPHVLTVPAGALTQTVSITAGLQSEPTVRLTFQPAGLNFGTPATLDLSYAHCDGLSGLVPKRVAYVDDLTLDILELIASVDQLLAQRVRGTITHFSSYAIAW